MTGDELSTLGARLDAAVSHWRDERRRKALPHVVEDARERANRLADQYSDAVVLAHTAPKLTRAQRLAAEAAARA